MAFPKLNMFSLLVHAGRRCIMIVYSFFVEGGAAEAGWTTLPDPLGDAGRRPARSTGQTLWLIGAARSPGSRR